MTSEANLSLFSMIKRFEAMLQAKMLSNSIAAVGNLVPEQIAHAYHSLKTGNHCVKLLFKTSAC